MDLLVAHMLIHSVSIRRLTLLPATIRPAMRASSANCFNGIPNWQLS